MTRYAKRVSAKREGFVVGHGLFADCVWGLGWKKNLVKKTAVLE